MELSQDMMNELKAESVELVERFTGTWMTINALLEQGRTVGRAEIDELFRILHSLKGLSEIAELPRLVSALHLLEDRLTDVRAEKSSLDNKDLETLAECQLLLEKIFVSDGGFENDSLMTELEYQAQVFCVGGASVATPQVQGFGSRDGENVPQCNPLSSAERELWESFLTRPEFIYSFVCDQNNSEVRDRINSIGSILIDRQHQKKSLFVFAAELDQALLEQIVEGEVRLLQKVISALASLGAPWTGLLGEKHESFIPAVKEVAAQMPAVIQSHQPENLVSIEETSPSAEAAASISHSFDVVENEADPEMVADFLNNADELLESLTQAMLMLENNPDDRASVEEIFRAAHTIKGTAGMLGFGCIEQLCHVIENTFDRIRKNQLSVSAPLIDSLLIGWDLVRNLFSLLRSGKKPQIPLEEFFQRLSASERGELVAEPQIAQTRSDSINIAASIETSSGKTIKTEAPKSDSQGTIRVDLKRLDSLVNLVGELVIDRTRFARIEEAMRLRGASADLSHQMAESVLLFGRHMNEVQNIIMKVRMVPVGNAFYKFSRVVRDLSRQCGKEVELVVHGGETELDKTLVEEIGDPLVHLIRNSIDHGIEEPEQREANGKTRKGQIRLSASQQGNLIVICVEDDGKGLDVERIRAKAIRNGIIKENENIPPKDIFNLIFEPGFSTAEKVTNISGRGVGMDVVKKNIQKLKGVVELDSVQGKGTKTTIKLPITLAIVPSLMVEVAGESFAIPLVNVIESIRISADEIQRMGTAQFVKLRDQVVPLARFSDVMGLTNIESNFWYRPTQTTPALSRRRERLVFVVVGIGHERLGLVVDKLLGQQEIVIKPLGKLLGNHPGLAGGCVLGDGRVALVIDVADVAGSESFQRGVYARRAPQAT